MAILRLDAPRPNSSSSRYPERPETVGDHLCKARMDEGLGQEHVAAELGASVFTICDWAGNHTSMATRSLLKMVAFRGYDPRQESGQLGDRIRMLRERQGLLQAILAAKLGLNVLTVVAWERQPGAQAFPKRPAALRRCWRKGEGRALHARAAQHNDPGRNPGVFSRAAGSQHSGVMALQRRLTPSKVFLNYMGESPA